MRLSLERPCGGLCISSNKTFANLISFDPAGAFGIHWFDCQKPTWFHSNHCNVPLNEGKVFGMWLVDVDRCSVLLLVPLFRQNGKDWKRVALLTKWCRVSTARNNFVKCIAGESLHISLEGIELADADLSFSGEYANVTLVRWKGEWRDG